MTFKFKKACILFLLLFFIIAINCKQDCFKLNNKSNYLKIMSHNIFIMSGIGSYSQGYNEKQRIEEIKIAKYWKNNDVLVFQEAFNEPLIDKLKNELHLNGYIYQTNIIGNPDDKINLNGGVFIVSKINFEKVHYEIYENKCGLDSFSHKGFIHIKINLNDTLINIIGTHTQADDKLCLFSSPKNIRFKQLDKLNKYINDNIKNSEIILLVGDLNINKGGDEYNEFLKKYNFNPPVFYGWNYTLDTINNSIAKDRYSNYNSEYLDYTFIKYNNHKNTYLCQKALKINSNKYEWKSVTYSDFSDHYPIFSYLILD
jgi:sphingomyelin phosphodiesterase